MYFDKNFTYSGSWDVYGGDTPTNDCDGASGTGFFYHNGRNYNFYVNNVYSDFFTHLYF